MKELSDIHQESTGNTAMESALKNVTAIKKIEDASFGSHQDSIMSKVNAGIDAAVA